MAAETIDLAAEAIHLAAEAMGIQKNSNMAAHPLCSDQFLIILDLNVRKYHEHLYRACIAIQLAKVSFKPHRGLITSLDPKAGWPNCLVHC